MDQVCGYCGQASSEPLNRYGTHDYCMYEPEDSMPIDKILTSENRKPNSTGSTNTIEIGF